MTNGLHRAFAKGLAAHQRGPLVVLQGPGHDFTGRCRSFIDQHHQGDFFQGTASGLGHAGDRVVGAVTTPELGRSLVGELALFELSVGGDHGDVVWQKCGRQSHCRIQQTARIVAQVEHQALHLRVLFVHFFDLAGEVIHGAFLELGHPDPAVTRFDQFGFDRLGLDLFADDGDRESAVFGFAEDGQDHFGFGLTAHALDRFAQRQALERCVIDFGNQVVGFETRAVSWRALNRRDDFDDTIFLADFDANAYKSSGRAFRKLFEAFFVEILRVRVQAGHHAGDGFGDEFALVDRLDVIAFDHAENGRQLLQLFQGQRSHVATRHGLQ